MTSHVHTKGRHQVDEQKQMSCFANTLNGNLVIMRSSGCTFPAEACPRGLTVSWWGCYGLCHRHKPIVLAHSFFFVLFLCLFLYCLYGPFNSISFHKFSRQLFDFSISSSGLNSALLILSTMYLFIKVSLSPDLILCG